MRLVIIALTILCSFLFVSGNICAAQATLLPVGQTSGWQLTFQDEFDGTALDTTKWSPQDFWCDVRNNELQAYEPAEVSVSSGLLHLVAEKKSANYGYCGKSSITKNYASGIVTTADKFDQQYGYFEARCKVPKGNGFWPAFWLMPYDKWPPEIDVMEHLGEDPDKVYMTNWWGTESNPKSKGGSYTGPDFSSDFHVFGAEWTSGNITWYVDGVQRFNSTSTVPSEPFFIILNLAIGGDWPVPPDSSTTFPSEFQVDYVRVWKASSGTNNSQNCTSKNCSSPGYNCGTASGGQINIRFLGTCAADTGCPSYGRQGASILLNSDMIMDFSCWHGGTCGVARLRQYNIDMNAINYVLITHHHEDHLDPEQIVALAQARTSSTKLTLYGGVAVADTMNSYLESIGKPNLINVVHLEPYTQATVGPYTVTPLIANHDSPENEPYVYIVGYGGRQFLYGTDSGTLEGTSLAKVYATKFDLVIRERTFEDDNRPEHMDYNKVEAERADWIDRGVITDSTPYYLTHLAYCGKGDCSVPAGTNDSGDGASVYMCFACTDGCPALGQKQCSGTGVQTCGDYNGDNCLEWSYVAPCLVAQTCVNGTCICAPKNCSQLGYNCGVWSNSCGGVVNCGFCSPVQICRNGQCIAKPIPSNVTIPQTCKAGQVCTIRIANCTNGLLVIRNQAGTPINITHMIISGDFPITFFSKSPYIRPFATTSTGKVGIVALCLGGTIWVERKEIVIVL